MYQPYPGGTQLPGPLSVPEPPAITMAARFMYAGAVASLAGIALNVATAGSMRSQISRIAPKLTPAQVTSFMHIQVVFLIISGLVAVGAWAWMAWACKAGRGWGRIVATVFFALNTVGVILGFAGGATSVGSSAGRLFGIVIWLIGLAAIILLWQRPASEFFRGNRQRLSAAEAGDYVPGDGHRGRGGR